MGQTQLDVQGLIVARLVLSWCTLMLFCRKRLSSEERRNLLNLVHGLAVAF